MRGYRYLICLLVALVILIEVCAHRLLLPGSDLSMGKAVSQTDTIVVAKLVSLGFTLPGAAGAAEYTGAQIEVEQRLKGSPPTRLRVTIRVIYEIGRLEESTPVEGADYLFLIHEEGGKWNTVLKMLPSTYYNIAVVKAALALSKMAK